MVYKDYQWGLAQAKADTLRRFLEPGDPLHNWYYKRLGSAIKAFRADIQLSQAELARRLDMPAPLLCLIEGGNQPFYMHDYKRICDALSISLTQLDERSETFKEGA